MFERMLNKQIVPTIEEMTAHCTDNAEDFAMINSWLTNTFSTEQKISFPYGNKYGWSIRHYKKKKLICNIFPEVGAFTIMMRLTNKQYKTLYDSLQKYTQNP
ncbi:MAG: DUF3788 family protein [Erysipelotrichaceae bacterium]